MAELLEPSVARQRKLLGFPLVDADISATANINATKIGTGVVSNTEFDRLNGITSALEEQGNKGAVSGYAGLDASQELLLVNFPAGAALEVLRRNAGNTALEFAAGASLPVVDTTSIVEGSADATKELRFEVDGNTTGIIGVIATIFTTAKTITIPDATDTLVGKATTDTLTNKTIGAVGQITGIANANLTTGVFAAITGLGVQTQPLDMGGNLIDNATALVSNAANPAALGAVRLGNAESIRTRNAGNTADLGILFDASDEFTFVGTGEIFGPKIVTNHAIIATIDGAADYFLVLDATDSTVKRVLGNNLPGGGVILTEDIEIVAGVATIVGTPTPIIDLKINTEADIGSDILDHLEPALPRGTIVFIRIEAAGRTVNIANAVGADPNFRNISNATQILNNLEDVATYLSNGVTLLQVSIGDNG